MAQSSTRQGQQRARELRQQHARAERRRRLLLGAAVVVVVLAVIGSIVAVGLSGGKKPADAATLRIAAPATDVAKVTKVPASTLERVGAGSVKTLPQPIKAPPLTADGKPQVLYVGAEYCPYCAAERWAVVQALSRFGTFDNLGKTASSSQDVFPNTPTFSFHGASYTSGYIAFTGKELESNKVVGNRYGKLDTLTPGEQQVFATYSANQAFPFVDLGGRYVVNGLQFDNQVLQGNTFTQIADALADPSSPVAQAIDGTANSLIAAICRLTGGKPAAACSAPAVTALQAKLGG